MVIEVYDGERRLVRVRLHAGHPVVIGRALDCDLALPFDQVSRHHLRVMPSADALQVDVLGRSASIEGREVREVRLEVGATLDFGGLSLRVRPLPADDATVETRWRRMPAHESLVGAGVGLAMSRATLRFEQGPLAGEARVLKQSRVVITGASADLLLGDPGDARPVVLRVVRGRVMVEPGGQPVYVAGQRVREVFPVLEDEPIRIGDHVFSVQPQIVQPAQRGQKRLDELVGSSSVMQELFAQLERVAHHDATVLLRGASGTGKELAARALHRCGGRADGPWVTLNCAALPEGLVEAELFGAAQGAYTGAVEARVGAFTQANGGTLFLDEVGDMSLDVQAKLLRVLETGEVRPLGAAKVSYPDVRVVCATHRDLRAAVREGTFREDLYYRIGVLQLELPALREHLEDLEELVTHLLSQAHPGARCSPAALDRLSAHRWPGNVRELRNVLTRAVVLYGGQPILPEHLTIEPEVEPVRRADPYAEERDMLEALLRRCEGNQSRAARELGVPRTTLLYKLRRHGLG